MKFNNIRLLVNDFDRCFTFYKETLGLECTWGQPGENYASFNIGAPSGLALFKASLMPRNQVEQEDVRSKSVVDKSVLVLQTDNVDETYSKLLAAGVSFINEPTDMPDWGIRMVHFRDPEHNLIELFTELPRS